MPRKALKGIRERVSKAMASGAAARIMEAAAGLSELSKNPDAADYGRFFDKLTKAHEYEDQLLDYAVTSLVASAKPAAKKVGNTKAVVAIDAAVAAADKYRQAYMALSTALRAVRTDLKSLGY